MARAMLRESASTLGNGIWGVDGATAGGGGDAGAAPPRGASVAGAGVRDSGAPGSTGGSGAAAVSTAGAVAAVHGSGAGGGSTAAVSTGGASIAAAPGWRSRGVDSTGCGSTGEVSSDGHSTRARSPERADIVRDLAFLALTVRPADALDASGSLGPAPPFSFGLLGLAMATCFLAARSCFSTY